MRTGPDGKPTGDLVQGVDAKREGSTIPTKVSCLATSPVWRGASGARSGPVHTRPLEPEERW